MDKYGGIKRENAHTANYFAKKKAYTKYVCYCFGVFLKKEIQDTSSQRFTISRVSFGVHSFTIIVFVLPYSFNRFGVL